jgi:asparagine synthase (glutamine-hydrolysing)
MCGFAVIVAAREPVGTDEGWAAVEAMRHRGPDGAGVAAFGPDGVTVSRAGGDAPAHGDVVLAHARLAVIDLSDAGFQPMTDEQERVWVVFNGEIFNFRELRAELEGRGHRFASRTDTEVLVHGWEEWQDGLLERIEGMFAFCLHDRATGRTVLARDRFGVKPLYYAHRRDGALVAASEIKALLATGVDARLDPEGLDAFLSWLWVPDPRTAFAGVEKLAPGHVLDAGGEPRTYWDFRHERGTASAEELREALERAVERQLVSDVPLGAFFSGGVDSTALVELMRRRIEPERPTCFTIGFSARDLAHDVVGDDLRYARLYANTHDVDYRESILAPELVDSLPLVVRHLEEPIADPSALSAFHISRAARAAGFTVLLSGMGGDELFGGYPRYRAAALARNYRRLPSALRHAAGASVGMLPGAGAGRVARAGRNAQKLLRSADRPFPDDYLGFLTYLDSAERAALYTPELAAAVGYADARVTHDAHLAAVAGEHWLDRAMYLDLKTFLPALNLTYMDKMSMAHSIEVRVPLLDELVVDVIRRAPPEEKREKQLFKRAVADVVPREILERPKVGFGAPVRGWLAHELRPLVDDLLSPARVHSRGLFKPEAVRGVVDDFRTGRRDTALQIWQLLTLELWHEAFLDAPVGALAA